MFFKKGYYSKNLKSTIKFLDKREYSHAVTTKRNKHKN